MHISDLPESIIETILTKLPLRDAVRTSVLSSQWRYKWATLTELEIDDECVSDTHYIPDVEIKLEKFVNQFFLLHDGPINRFTLSSEYLQESSYVDQWLVYLSRKGVKELSFALGEWFKAPSCLFTCKRLISLELVRCEAALPLCFNGFPNLKHLYLQEVRIAPDAVENLISSCTLLERLALSYFQSASLTIRAPNLKYLMLDGEFKDICLENTPMLVVISVDMNNMTDDYIAEHFGPTSSCNFDKLLGGVPFITRLTGRSYFAKYMSIGNTLREIQPTYQLLKVVELSQVGFDDMKEIMVILRLILSAPNLQQLQISSLSLETEAFDLDFWDKECPRGVTFEQLKVVKLTHMAGIPHEMRFIEFLLRSSPMLEVMDITKSVYDKDENEDMFTEVLGFERASYEVEFVFAEEQL